MAASNNGMLYSRENEQATAIGNSMAQLRLRQPMLVQDQQFQLKVNVLQESARENMACMGQVLLPEYPEPSQPPRARWRNRARVPAAPPARGEGRILPD